MSKEIRSYPIAVEPSQKIAIPFSSEILGIEDTKNGPILWAIVPRDTNPVMREVIIYDMGKELNIRCNRTNYLGYFLADKKTLHVFDVT